MRPLVLFGFACCVLLGLAFSDPGWAADYALIPQVLLEGEHNSNIFFDSDDEDPDKDYLLKVSPGLLLRRHAERLLGEIFAQGRFVSYQEEDDLNGTDQLYRAELDWTATEHMNLGANARYSIDNQIDRDIDVTGLVVGTAERQQQVYRGFGDLLVAERTRLTFSSGYTQDRFDDAEFWNSWGADAGLGMTHQPKSWPNTVLQGQLAYAHYAFDRDQTSQSGSIITRIEENNTTDNFSLSLGAETRQTERLTLIFSGGARYTLLASENDVNQRLAVGGGGPPVDLGTTTIDSDDQAWGFVGNASLAYRGERNELSVGLSHDLKPISGSGDTAQRTTLRGDWWYQMTTEWRINAGASYYLNRSDDRSSTNQDIDTDTLTLSSRLRYAFTRNLYLEGRYRYTRVEDHEEADTSQRHLVSASFFVQHDILD